MPNHKAPLIRGVMPILATPFTRDGEVDAEGFRRVIDNAIRDGANALVMFGLASEYYKLADSERAFLTELLIRHTAKRVPIVVSITHHAWEVAVKEARNAEKLGADALMVLPPFFLSPPADAILSHIDAIAGAVGIPVVIQYAPLQTGRTLDASLFVRLRAIRSNITCVKVDFVPCGPLVSEIRESSNGALGTAVGYMGLELPDALARGADGCMPTASLCRIYARIIELLQHHPEEGLALHEKLLPLAKFMMQSIEMLIACEKLILVRRGVISSPYCRAPASELDRAQRLELDHYVSDLAEWLPETPA